NWSTNAELLSKGEPVVALTSVADQPTDSVDVIESTAEQSEQPPNELPEQFPEESITTEPELSPETSLFEIFNEECQQHLHELKQSVAQEMSDSNIEIISRALHTIRGSANAVGVFGIAQIVGALEPFFYAVGTLPEKLEQQLLMLTSDSTILIEQLIEQPMAHFEAEISGFLLQLDELHEEIRIHERQDSDTDQAAVPELLMSDQVAKATGELLVHGMDCMSNSNLIIESWYSTTLDTPQQSELISQYEHLATLAQDGSVPQIIEISSLLEQIFQQLNPETTLEESTYQLLTTAQDTLFRILDNVAMGQRVTAVDTIIAELSQLLKTFAEPIPQIEVGSQILAGDEIDPETLEIFSEEARELCQNVEQAISAWLIEPQNELYPEELLRHLHTLKGGARVTGLDQFASFAHEFESFLTRIIPIPGEFEDSIKTQLLSQLEQLIENVDNLSGTIEPVSLPVAAPSLPEDSVIEQTDREDNIFSFSAAQTPLSESDQTEKRADQIKPATPSASPEVHAKKPAKTFTRVSTDLLESLVNLAGESSISRARTEQQVGALGNTLDEMQITLERLRNQIRQVDIETQTQSLRQKNEFIEIEHDGFDALEMDQYSGMQQLARSLMESTSDLLDLKESLVNKTRDAETTLLQQSRIHSELQAGLMRTRMVPFSKMVPRIRKGVRQTAAEVNKSVQVTVNNGEVEIDRTILERMIPALEHMLRNAVDHGIESPETRFKKGKPETGTITLDIRRDGGDMLIEVNDDGNGVDIDQLRKKAIAQNLMRANDPLSDQEVLQFILHSGISTAESITQISGRGVGLNVVNSEIKQLGGSIHISSTAGVGTQFIIRLPFTVSVTRALMLRTAGEQFAVPLSAIEGIVRVSPYELQNYYQPDAPNFEYAGQSYQMCYMGSLLETKHKPNLDGLSAPLPVILARSGDRAYAIQVDAILGSHEIVVKPLGPLFVAVNGFSGATILGDGSVVVILDLSTLIRGYSADDIYTEVAENNTDTATVSTETRVMVVDDSVTVRKVTSRLLRRNGMSVTLAKDGADAIEQLHDAIPDVMLLDIEMPKIDGFEVARVIRHNERWKHLPIIMISSRTGAKHREKAFAIGVNRFLGKPFQEAELLQNISELTDPMNSESMVRGSN
ncbi:MAG: response regulator, partial [Pseudomonadales bacterium]|nr:response regulator [Pseudomonadales bacterium]